VFLFTRTNRGMSFVSARMTMVHIRYNKRGKNSTSLENPGIWIIWNGGPTQTLENSAALFFRLGCVDDAIANFPPTLDGGPRRSLRRGPPSRVGASGARALAAAAHWSPLLDHAKPDGGNVLEICKVV